MSARQHRRTDFTGTTDPSPAAPLDHLADTVSERRSLVSSGVAAAALSVMGLAVAGGVAMTATAQADATSRSTASVGQLPDTSRAVPAPVSLEQQQAAAASTDHEADAKRDNGGLEAFAAGAAQNSKKNTNAVRVALQDAVSDQLDQQRSATLSATGEKANEVSQDAISKARAERLDKVEKAAADEKKKAEEARKKAEKEGSLDGAAPPMDVTPVESSGKGASPIAPGAYSLGARWGATGVWKRWHTGQDFPAPIGTPIRAAADGVVEAMSGGSWAGTHVILRHADGSHTLYAHMSSKTVQPGQQVKAGQQIGAVGMTGRTFGPHLHMEYYPAGARPGDIYSTKDPVTWLAGLGVHV